MNFRIQVLVPRKQMKQTFNYEYCPTNVAWLWGKGIAFSALEQDNRLSHCLAQLSIQSKASSIIKVIQHFHDYLTAGKILTFISYSSIKSFPDFTVLPVIISTR